MNVVGTTLITLFIASQAWAASGITYHGRILKSDDTPLTSSTAQFRIQVRTPGTENCLLWEESQNYDMSGSNGVFSITIADTGASAYLRSDGYSWGLDRVFSNRTNFSGLANCSVGTTYNPTGSDGRTLQVYFRETPVSTWEAMPLTKINFVPMAFNSLQLEGFQAAEFLKVDPASSYTTLTPANVNSLVDLITGASTVYIKPADALGGDLSGTHAAATVTRIRNTNVVATAPTLNQVLKFNGTNWAPAADDAGVTADASYAAKGVVQFDTNLATSGISVTAGVASLPNTIVGAGPTGGASSVPVLTYDNKGRLTAVTTATVDDTTKLPLAGGTMTGPINMGTQNITNATSVAATNFSGRNLVLNDNDTNTVTIRTPTDVTANYSLQLPPDDGTSNQVLTTDGAGILTWTSPASGISVTANQAVVANGTGTGLSSFTCAINQVMGFDGAGLPQCQNVTAAGGFVNGGNSFGAAPTLGTNDNFDLNFETNSTTKMTILANGNVGIGTTTPSDPLSIYRATGDSGLNITSAATGDAFIDLVQGGGNFWSLVNFNVGNRFGIVDDGVERFSIDSTGNVGIGTTTPGSKLTVRGTNTATSNNDLQSIDMTASPSSSQAANVRNTALNVYNSGVSGNAFGMLIGVDVTAGHDSGNSNAEQVIGGRFTANKNTGGTDANIIGTKSIANAWSGPTTTNLIGSQVSTEVSSGAVTNNYGLMISDLSQTGGTVANRYGIYLGSFTGSATSDFGIYQAGTSQKNFFAGNVGIGTAGPNTALDVNGAFSQRGMAAPAVSPAGQGRIYFDSTSNTFKVSQNNGAYVDLVGSGGALSGLTAGGVPYATSATAVTTDNANFHWDSVDKRLGIGTVAPTAPLSIVAGEITGIHVQHDTCGELLVNQTSGGVNFHANAGSSCAPGDIAFSTGPSLGYAPTTGDHKLFIQQAGNVGISNTDPTSILDVSGAITQRGMAAPATSGAGRGRIYFDSTTNKFRVSQNNGAYQDLIPAGGTGDILNGGNTTGAAVTVGTNDNFALNFETNGTNRMTVDNAGNVGIGTATPGAKLEISSAAGSSQTAIRNSDSANVYGYWDMKMSNYNYRLNGSSSANLAVEFADSNNVVQSQISTRAAAPSYFGLVSNVGIGTDTPGARLHTRTNASGTAAKFDTTFSSTSIFNVDLTSAGTTLMATGSGFSYPDNAGDLNLSVSNAVNCTAGNACEQIGLTVKNNSGFVGFGNNSPNTKLDLSGAFSQRGMAAPAVSPAGQGRIYFDSTANKFRISENNGAYTDLVGGGGSISGLTTGTLPKATSATSIGDSNIKESTGNIGIGTAAQSINHLLQVGPGDGSTNLTELKALVTNTGPSGIGVRNSTAAVESFMLVNNSQAEIGTRTNHPLYFSTNNNTQMAITNTGNVGIGTTSPNTLLDVNGAYSQRGMAAPAVSPAGQGRIYFDSTSNKFRVSQNNGAYTDLVNTMSGFNANQAIVANGAGVATSFTCSVGQVLGFDASGFAVCTTVAGSTGFINNGNSYGAAATLGTNDNFGLNFETNGTARMNISNSGNVGITNALGIGTTPGGVGKVDIWEDNDGYTTLNVTNQSAFAGAAASLNLFNNSGRTGSIMAVGTGNTWDANLHRNKIFIQSETSAGMDIASSHASGNIGFYTGGSAAAQNRMQISAAGNVGIGTTSPATALDINGGQTFRGVAAATTPAVAGQGKIYFDSTANKFKVSENNGAFVDLVSAGGGLSGLTAGGVPYATSATAVATDNANFHWDSTNKRLGLNNTSPSATLDIRGSPTAQEIILTQDNASLYGSPYTTIEHTYGPDYSAPLSIFTTNDTIGAIHVNMGTSSGNAFSIIGVGNGGANWDASALTAVSNGAYLPGPAFAGTTNSTGGTGTVIGAAINGRVDAAVSSGNLPTALVFRTSQSNSTGLTERMRVSSSGNVGIGTTSPGDSLHVSNSQTAPTSIQVQNTNAGAGAEAAFRAVSNAGTAWFGINGTNTAGGAAYVWNAANTAIEFATNDLERMRISATGDVGIGTTSPALKLDVRVSAVDDVASLRNTSTSGWSALRFEDSAGTQVGTVGFGNASASNNANVMILNSNSKDIIFGTTLANAGERMRISSAGNVGIGTSSPNTILDVNGAISARGMVAPALSPAGQGRIYFDSTANKFRVSQNNGAYVDLIQTSGDILNGGNTSGATITIGTNDGQDLDFETNGVTRMSIADNGSGVSIVGTTTDPVLYVNNTSNTGYISLSNNLTSGSFIESFRTGNSFEPLTIRSDSLRINSTDGAEAMRVDAAGNVGIGTTSPGSKLEVNGNIRAATGQISSAVYNNGSAVAFNLNNGNAQYTTASCQAMTFTNMQDGGSYSVAVKSTSGTCSFSNGGDTFRYAGGVSNVTITAHTIFTFVKMGGDVYVSWVSF